MALGYNSLPAGWSWFEVTTQKQRKTGDGGEAPFPPSTTVSAVKYVAAPDEKSAVTVVPGTARVLTDILRLTDADLNHEKKMAAYEAACSEGLEVVKPQRGPAPSPSVMSWYAGSFRDHCGDHLIVVLADSPRSAEAAVHRHPIPAKTCMQWDVTVWSPLSCPFADPATIGARASDKRRRDIERLRGDMHRGAEEIALLEQRIVTSRAALSGLRQQLGDLEKSQTPTHALSAVSVHSPWPSPAFVPPAPAAA
jgi:hypothetical protein